MLAGLGTVATVLPPLIGAAADVAGYFRSDYTVAKVSVTSTSTPLIAAVAGALRAKGIVVHVDGFAVFDGRQATLAAFGRLLDARWRSFLGVRLNASQVVLQQAKDEAVEAEAAFDAAKAADTADATPDHAAALAEARVALAKAQSKVAVAQGLVDAAVKVEELVDALVTAVTTVADGQVLPPLGQAALHDLIHDPTAGVHVLAVVIDHIGADAITRRSLFRRPRITYVGAVHVSALLLAPGGDVAASRRPWRGPGRDR